jgi:hypothetical protein
MMSARHVTHLDNNDVRWRPWLLMPSILAIMHLHHNVLTVTGMSVLLVINRWKERKFSASLNQPRATVCYMCIISWHFYHLNCNKTEDQNNNVANFKGHSMQQNQVTVIQYPHRNRDVLHNIHHMLMYHQWRMPTEAKYRQQAWTETA